MFLTIDDNCDDNDGDAFDTWYLEPDVLVTAMVWNKVKKNPQLLSRTVQVTKNASISDYQ